MKIVVETTSSDLTNHAGLFSIGKYFKTSNFGKEIIAVSCVRDRKEVPSDRDIVFCMIALYALGKPTYEAIEEYRYDRFFRQVLGVRRVPSEATLRQRIEQLPDSILKVIRRWNREIIAAGFADVSDMSSKKQQWIEAVTIGEKQYMIFDSDVSVLDNSNSKREGVSWTYKKCDGYAPMFSCIAKSGYMINNELREGSAHSNCEGAVDYFAETIALAKAVSPPQLLMVLDSGNDARTVLQELLFTDVFFVIRWNLRKESAHQWLTYDKEHAESVREGRDGSQVYYATEELNLSF